jgi:hypothetical protein
MREECRGKKRDELRVNNQGLGVEIKRRGVSEESKGRSGFPSKLGHRSPFDALLLYAQAGCRLLAIRKPTSIIIVKLSRHIEIDRAPPYV